MRQARLQVYLCGFATRDHRAHLRVAAGALMEVSSSHRDQASRDGVARAEPVKKVPPPALGKQIWAGEVQMSQMPISQLVDGASELLRFHTARAALVAYLATAAELRWRFRRLNKSDRRLQAVGELTAAGICSFRMCADACAFLYAQSQPDRSSPGFNSAGDVFYGRSLACATRAADW